MVVVGSVVPVFNITDYELWEIPESRVCRSANLTKILLRCSAGFKPNSQYSLSWLEVWNDFYRNLSESCKVMFVISVKHSFSFPSDMFIMHNHATTRFEREFCLLQRLM